MKEIIAIIAFAFLNAAHADVVELVVPFPPGGGTDVVGRIVADGLTTHGTDVVVVNKPGANGAIGTDHVIKAKADGKTMLLTGTSFLFNKLLKNPAANYDLLDSLDHVFVIGWSPNYLYARSDLPQKSLKEILDTTKKNPNAYTWGVTNAGAEFTAKLIGQKLGVTLNIIVYKGTTQGITDLIGKHVDLVIDGTRTPMIVNAIDNNSILVVGSTEPRDKSPVSFEHQLPGIKTSTWFGISVPKNTPMDVKRRINSDLNRIAADPVVREKLRKNDIRVVGGDLTRFPDWIKSEVDQYSAFTGN